MIFRFLLLGAALLLLAACGHSPPTQFLTLDPAPASAAFSDERSVSEGVPPTSQNWVAVLSAPRSRGSRRRVTSTCRPSSATRTDSTCPAWTPCTITLVSPGVTPDAEVKVTTTSMPRSKRARTPRKPTIIRAATGTAQIRPGQRLRMVRAFGNSGTLPSLISVTWLSWRHPTSDEDRRPWRSAR